MSPAATRESALHSLGPKKRLVLATLPRAIAGALRLTAAWTRYEVRNEHIYREALAAGPVLLAVWHESISLGVPRYVNTEYNTLVSQSFDGEIAARVVRRFGINAIRGSSSRRGSEALRELEDLLRAGGLVGWNLDGPRGPRRVAKPGIAVLAARTHSPVIPHAFSIRGCLRMRSWDRLPVPLPGARVISAYGPLIAPPDDESPEAIEAVRAEVERSLNTLHAQLDAELGANPMLGEAETP